jgi:hypothetical protein
MSFRYDLRTSACFSSLLCQVVSIEGLTDEDLDNGLTTHIELVSCTVQFLKHILGEVYVDSFGNPDNKDDSGAPGPLQNHLSGSSWRASYPCAGPRKSIRWWRCGMNDEVKTRHRLPNDFDDLGSNNLSVTRYERQVFEHCSRSDDGIERIVVEAELHRFSHNLGIQWRKLETLFRQEQLGPLSEWLK